MAPKAKAAAAAPSKKAKENAPAKGAEKSAAKKGGKAAAAADKEIDITAAPGDGAPVVDQDELEEAADEAAAASGGGSSNDAALAAASGSGEMSASFKNFRHHPDMENFYRFIYENDLRHEALGIIDKIMAEKIARRTQPKSGKAGH